MVKNRDQDVEGHPPDADDEQSSTCDRETSSPTKTRPPDVLLVDPEDPKAVADFVAALKRR